ILRPGPLTAAQLTERLGAPVHEHRADTASARSPGQRARHYAPSVPAVRVGSLAEAVALGLGPHDALVVIGHGAPALDTGATVVVLPDPQTAARRLYAVLRECDAPPTRRMVIVLPPQEPQWHALADRLLRATTTVPRQAR
ncbi:MAG: translation factor Sua5, partial [Deltaproteobacteria bacterium]|nr:translation factor Sua5 [Deltaproteobacteria bacterium]